MCRQILKFPKKYLKHNYFGLFQLLGVPQNFFFPKMSRTTELDARHAAVKFNKIVTNTFSFPVQIIFVSREKRLYKKDMNMNGTNAHKENQSFSDKRILNKSVKYEHF